MSSRFKKTKTHEASFYICKANKPSFHNFKIASRHDSINHFGVLVAPQIPTELAFSNHSF